MIVIPVQSWETMLDAFASIAANVERVAYFDGIEIGQVGTVTTVTVPNARLFEKYFEVSAESMSEAGKHLRRYRMVRLAQVHTHPGFWTDHSKWDDERAFSQIPGAISIVLPFHARNRPSLEDSGVHVREQETWRRLEEEEIEKFVKVVPGYLDFRRQS